MAAKDQTDAGWNDASTGAAANSEWHDVDAESQIILEMVGEGFIGRFMGMDAPNASGIVQAHWTNVTDLNNADIADKAFINATRDMQNKLKHVPIKSMVRAEWIDNLDTGHESGVKMRVFKVQWK